MAAIRRATAFAFARVLAFAAVVTRLTATLAFARIRTLAGVLVFVFLLAHFEQDARFAVRSCGVRLHGERSAHQTGNRGTGNQCFRFHVGLSFFVFGRPRVGTIPPESIKLMKKLRLNQRLSALPPKTDAILRQIFLPPILTVTGTLIVFATVGPELFDRMNSQSGQKN